MLRQQEIIADGKPNRSLADFIAPRESGVPDYLGMFAVTAGIGAEELARRFELDHDDYNAIMVKALADRLAEAFAEHLHAQARKDWGYGEREQLTVDDLVGEKFRGIRPAFGYPACPDHSEKFKLFDLLEAQAQGITLTDSAAMLPAASVSGLYFSHPQSKYFNIGRVSRDQAESYATRKGVPLEEVERWLAPNLGYEPAAQTVGRVGAWLSGSGIRDPDVGARNITRGPELRGNLGLPGGPHRASQDRCHFLLRGVQRYCAVDIEFRIPCQPIPRLTPSDIRSP